MERGRFLKENIIDFNEKERTTLNDEHTGLLQFVNKDGKWLMQIDTIQNRISFNEQDFPAMLPNDFARAIVEILTTNEIFHPFGKKTNEKK